MSVRPLLALLGGSFDPPHVGHLIVASDAACRLGADRLLLILASEPPLKERSVTPAPIRLEMLRAAVADDPILEVDDRELRREGTSYTVDTLRELREELGAGEPERELAFLMGADQLADLHRWREPEEVARLARLVVMARAGEEPAEVDSGLDVTYEKVEVPRIDLSSTDIRHRVREGRPIRYLVPERVREIIEREGLYR